LAIADTPAEPTHKKILLQKIYRGVKKYKATDKNGNHADL